MNPLGQIISLSLVVHICIILWKKLTRRKIRSQKQMRVGQKKLLSLLIITAVATVVLSLTGAVIESSISDPRSNIHTVAGIISGFHPPVAAVGVEKTGSGTLRQAVTVSSSSASSCKEVSTHSIVEQLQARGMPSDFDSRAALARTIHIDEYLGRKAQNSQLIRMLNEKFGEIPSHCTE